MELTSIPWPAAVVIAITTQIPAILTYYRAARIDKRSASNSAKLDHNNKVTEETCQKINEVGVSINGRMEQLLQTHAELALIKAKQDGSLNIQEIQTARANRIIVQAQSRVKLLGKLSIHSKDNKDQDNSILILIVEDNRTDATLIAVVLDHMGFQTNIAANSDEVILLITENRYSAVFVDLNLPGGLDGFEVIKIIYAAIPGIPIFAITGYLDKAVEEAAKLIGAINVVEKPITIEKIKALFKMHNDPTRLQELKKL